MSYFIYVLFYMRDSYNDAGIDIILFIGVYISLQFHTRVIIWKKKEGVWALIMFRLKVGETFN